MPEQHNPLASRADLQNAVHALWEPVRARLSPGGARARLGHTGANFCTTAAELEGFSRPLWGLVPLAVGGGTVDWDPILHGLAAGSDPEHPEYWGLAADRDQRLVEMAAIGLGLAMLPEQLWDPLRGTARDNLARWLSRINDVGIVDSNWLFFRVLVNQGLRRVGAAGYNPDAEAAALDRLEEFALDGGWYQDGPTGRCDYYVPWALHYYGLLYGRLAAEQDAARAQRFVDRAAAFAPDFAYWFAADGAALPYGRSLTYRFAQGGFWGALAYADVDALPWGEVKGLALRNLRWWWGQQSTDDAGLLTIGYAYPNLNMAENYNSPGSPYWAMKAFLPLALDGTHPFWAAEEAGLPELESVTVQEQPRMILCRDAENDDVVALTGGQHGPGHRHGAEKYAKFAYSTRFAFSVPTGNRGLDERAPDSVLALSDDEVHWRVRETPEDVDLVDGVLWSRWLTWPDVEIETWLLPWLPWHVRVHRLRTDRPLWSAEGGWAVDRTGDDPAHRLGEAHAEPGWAYASYLVSGNGASGLRDLAGERAGKVVRAAPNTNLLHARTALPVLRGQHPPGEHWLACAVLGVTTREAWDDAWKAPPTLAQVRAALPDDVAIPDPAP